MTETQKLIETVKSVYDEENFGSINKLVAMLEEAMFALEMMPFSKRAQTALEDIEKIAQG